MIIRPKAEADLADAREWYENQREGLGDEFLHSIQEVLARIEGMPDVLVVNHRGVRRALVRRFPFAVYYRFDGNEVDVIGVLHTRRDPGRWQSRVSD